jgi:hypothetical protein
MTLVFPRQPTPERGRKVQPRRRRCCHSAGPRSVLHRGSLGRQSMVARNVRGALAWPPPTMLREERHRFILAPRRHARLYSMAEQTSSSKVAEHLIRNRKAKWPSTRTCAAIIRCASRLLPTVLRSLFVSAAPRVSRSQPRQTSRRLHSVVAGSAPPSRTQWPRRGQCCHCV